MSRRRRCANCGRTRPPGPGLYCAACLELGDAARRTAEDLARHGLEADNALELEKGFRALDAARDAFRRTFPPPGP